MKTALWLAAIACGALGAQTGSVSDQETARTRELLAAPDLRAKAWGIYRAGRLHSEEMNAALADQLPLYTAFGAASWRSEPYALLATLFDALIESGATVSPQLLAPYAEAWPAPVAILLSRGSGGEDILLRMRDTKDNALWLAANSLLLLRKSQPWYEALWKELRLTHRFEVVAPNATSGWGAGLGIGGVSCGDGVTQLAPGFPPAALYALETGGRPGTVLLAQGPLDAFYVKLVVPVNRQVPVGHCETQLDRNAMLAGYLDRLARAAKGDAEKAVTAHTRLVFTGQEAFEREALAALKRQQAALSALAQTAGQAGFAPPRAGLQIAPEISDHRGPTPGPPLRLPPYPLALP